MTASAAFRRHWRPAGSAKGLCLALLLAAPLLVAAPARADFAAGVRAYEAGDYAAAHAAWLPIAERNDVAAMRNIGHLYRWGQGVEQDIHKALDWYRRAAELGFSRAQANLAAIYLQGEDGVKVNYDEAYKWFAAAAIQGHAVAQYNLGLMYELGLGTEKNEAKALGWYNNAARAGQPEALDRLSQLVRRPEQPLLSGVRAAAPAEDRTENAAAGDLPPATAAVTPVETPAAPPPPAAAAPPVESDATPVAAPLEVPAISAPTELPSAEVLATPAPPPAAAPVEPPPPPPERPGLLGRIYNAFASGGGISIPDIFDSGEETPVEKKDEARP
jgi:hypothetical protein